MIDLRGLKRELDAMIEERDNMDTNNASMDEMNDMDYRIEGLYQRIAEAVLNEKVIDEVQDILREPTVLLTVKIADYNLRNRYREYNMKQYFWSGDEVPSVGQQVFIDTDDFNGRGIVVDIEYNKDISIKDEYPVGAAYEEESPVYTTVMVEDNNYNTYYALWKETGAIEDGEWNDKDEPIPGRLCALRLGYRNYVEAHIIRVEQVLACELKNYEEKTTIYKAYDYDRMILQKYSFDPDEEGKPEETKDYVVI